MHTAGADWEQNMPEAHTRPPANSNADLLGSRATRLFVILSSFLAVNAICAEFVGVKIFALEPTLGLEPLNWNLFGQSGSLSFTSGVLLWPFVFLMTDIINEYFGRRGVQFISWLTVALIPFALWLHHPVPPFPWHHRGPVKTSRAWLFGLLVILLRFLGQLLSLKRSQGVAIYMAERAHAASRCTS